jgi:hypothetical protein
LWLVVKHTKNRIELLVIVYFTILFVLKQLDADFKNKMIRKYFASRRVEFSLTEQFGMNFVVCTGQMPLLG